MSMSSKQWQSGDKKNDEEIQNLYIFGYQSKIFRDDEKAMYIDQGKHLIPWMGDSSLMIDSNDPEITGVWYDGRGHIYDLKPYDADSVDRHHFDLTDRDKAIEKACDEERYLELHTDASEQQVYEEEEMKRLYEAMGEGYAAVGFNYDQQPQLVTLPPKPVDVEEEEDPYEPIQELKVPKGVHLPKTMKMHAIIEKTASFVAKQGPQMEIVVATKQSNNPQFKFLHYSHELNVYYKHIVKMIKKGKYIAKPQEEYQTKKKRRSSESMDSQHGYLHPSLGGQAEPEPPPVSSEKFLESVQSKLPSGQIANTAYAKLLSNLSKHRAESPVPKPAAVQTKPPLVQENKKPTKPTEVKGIGNKLPPVPGMDPVTLPGLNQPPPPGTVPPEPPPYSNSTVVPPPAASNNNITSSYEPSLPNSTTAVPGPYLPPQQSGTYQYDYYHGYGTNSNGVYNSMSGAVDSSASYPESQVSQQSHSEAINTRNRPDDGYMAGNLDTENEDSSNMITQPPEHLRPIIDKMAQYVVRNGPEFEMMMKNKQDERFSFLESSNELFPYYQYRKGKFKQEEEGSGDGSDAGDDNQGSSKSVSFSIKTKDPEAAQMAAKRALLGDSDDEEDILLRGRLEEKDPTDSFKRDNVTVENADAEKKQAEESLKNKLALAARGKLAQAKEEEKVKAERKKKAAMFAALLKNNTDNAAGSTLNTVSSVSSLASLPGAGNSPPASPNISTVSRSSSVTKSPLRKSRSRTRSPSVVITKETYVSKSRSGTPMRKSRLRKSRSRSRERRRSRSRSWGRSSRVKSSRRSRSRSPRRRKSKSPPLPSAYCVIRRSVSPKSSVLKRRSKSRSPSRRKRNRRSRSRSPKSRSRRSRSRSRSKRSKRSRSRTKSSKSKKRPKSKDRKRSRKSSKKSRPKMIPIPELTPPPAASQSASSDSESDEDVIITDGTSVNVTNEKSQDTSAATTPVRSSDNEIPTIKPSNNLLSKVRAMLKAQREELMKEDGEIND